MKSCNRNSSSFVRAAIPRIQPNYGYVGFELTKNHVPSQVLIARQLGVERKCLES